MASDSVNEETEQRLGGVGLAWAFILIPRQRYRSEYLIESLGKVVASRLPTMQDEWSRERDNSSYSRVIIGKRRARPSRLFLVCLAGRQSVFLLDSSVIMQRGRSACSTIDPGLVGGGQCGGLERAEWADLPWWSEADADICPSNPANSALSSRSRHLNPLRGRSDSQRLKSSESVGTGSQFCPQGARSTGPGLEHRNQA